MALDPRTFIRERFPALFEHGVTLVQSRASEGDARARARLEDIRASRGAVRLVIEPAGEVLLVVADGTMTAADSLPEDMPVRLAVAVPEAACRAGLEELDRSGLMGRDGFAVRLARTASARVEPVLAKYRLELHVVVTEVPELGDVRVRVGLGVGQPPETPRFTATVRFDDLEDIREGLAQPQQLLMGGKVRFGGDYSPALQLGMELMQLNAGQR